jgi:hypothetical protein
VTGCATRRGSRWRSSLSAIKKIERAGETPTLGKAGLARAFDQSFDPGEQGDHEREKNEKHEGRNDSEYEFSSSV